MKYRILIIFILVLLVPIVGAQVYTITDLGRISPAGINILGQIAAVNAKNHAVIWSAGKVRDLGLLSGGTYSVPMAINDVGAVVGIADSLITHTDDSGTWTMIVPVSFVWTAAHGMQTFGYIGSSGGNPARTISYATGINNFGRIILDNTTLGHDISGFLWTKMFGLRKLPSGADYSEAIGINNRGQITGWIAHGEAITRDDCCYALAGPRASIWENGVPALLGTVLSPSDLFWQLDYGVAFDLNDLTQVVGWSLYNSGSGSPDGSGYVRHAFFWTQNDGMQDLGTLPGDLSSEALKINFFGQVIGLTYVDNRDDARPFIWTRQEGMRDINTLVNGGSRWMLRSVSGINAWGQIVGSGTLNGETHGFLLKPKRGLHF